VIIYRYSRVVYISSRVGVYCIIKYIVLAAYTYVVYIHMTYLYNDLFYYIISDADRHAISSKKKIPNLSDKCYCHVRQTTKNNNGKYMYTQTQYSTYIVIWSSFCILYITVAVDRDIRR